MMAKPLYDDTTVPVCCPFNSWGCIVCSRPRPVAGSIGTVKMKVAGFTNATAGDCSSGRSSERYCLSAAAKGRSEQAGPATPRWVAGTFP